MENGVVPSIRDGKDWTKRVGRRGGGKRILALVCNWFADEGGGETVGGEAVVRRRL
jgi:hypothetical protein